MKLKDMGVKVGKMDRLKTLATELGIEPEDGQDEFDLAEAMMAAINSKDDTAWEAMTADLKEWSNTINSAKKLYVDAAAKAEKKGSKSKTAAPPTAPTEAAPPPAAAKDTKSKKKPPAAPKPKAATKAPAAPATKKAPTAPPAANLDELKARAKAKATDQPKKKFVIGDKPYRVGANAWHVAQAIKEAGKTGITIADGIKAFEKRIAKHKLVCRNPAGWATKIFKECVKIKGLAEQKEDRFYPTKKLIQAE